MFTAQTACVARHPEPVFCPNAEELPLSLTGALLDRRTTPTTYNIHYDSVYDDDDDNADDDDDDDDDHDGGVSLTINDHDLPNDDTNDLFMDDTPVHNTTNPSVALNAPLSRERPESRRGALARQSAGHDWRTRHHPRPEARETWEEEDGRRSRLALERGPPDAPHLDLASMPAPRTGISSSHVRDRSSASISPSHASRAAPTSLSTDRSRAVSRRASHQNVSSHVPTQPAQEVGAASIQHSNTNSMTATHSYDEAMELDDDAMAVDDPRRTYDFADFMDNWRLRSMHDKRLPPYEPGLQPSIRVGRSHHRVTRKHVRSHEVDMQGLRWKLIGPSRRDANVARDLLHPSRATSSDLAYSKRHILAEQERHFSFKSFLPGRRAKFNHYQLRNVLTGHDRNSLLYAAGNVVKQASLSCPAHDKTVMDLSSPANCAAGFRITCISATKASALSDSNHAQVLLAGGFYGEYAVLGRSSPSAAPAVGFVTHAYNGLVTHLHNYPGRRSGLTQAVFCSNDCNVRIMDVCRLQFTNSFEYENAVNCAATSPDGRLRALVGDSPETLITDAERGTTLVTLREHTDHAFACDWSPDGRSVVTGAQDGMVLVWDARNWAKPLRHLDSAMTCARSLNFTDDGALVAAENDDVVRVYHSRTYDSMQEMRFFGSIAGLALLDGGAELVVANADKTVGGLLTFERTPQGRSDGSYGKRLKGGGATGSHRRRHGGSITASDMVDDLHV